MTFLSHLFHRETASDHEKALERLAAHRQANLDSYELQDWKRRREAARGSRIVYRADEADTPAPHKAFETGGVG